MKEIKDILDRFFDDYKAIESSLDPHSIRTTHLLLQESLHAINRINELVKTAE